MNAKPGLYGIEDLFKSSQSHPDYRKTLANLNKVSHPVCRHEGDALRFTNYPFEAASVFPDGLVYPEQISEVNLGRPSQIRLKDGDILFVPGEGKEALIDFVNRHNLPVIERLSVWTSLLDPFLDTWEEQETIDRQFAWFERLGLGRESVDRWRREVAIAMIAYNFGAVVWEWVALSLYDMLVAQRACLPQAAFADFYRRALKLAEMDPPAPVGKAYGVSP